jgi:predicted RecA/RadA family phage recombinase
MKTYLQSGDILTVTVPYSGGVTAGQGVMVGSIFGVAQSDAAQNAQVEIVTRGVFDLPKDTSQSFTAGARIFWDNTNRRLTTTATGNFQVAIATQAAATSDATARVALMRVPASGA